MCETIQVKIRGWFLRALGFKVLIRFNHISCVSYQQGGYIYKNVFPVNVGISAPSIKCLTPIPQTPFVQSQFWNERPDAYSKKYGT